MEVRLGVVKQSFFGLPGQYGRRVTRANNPSSSIFFAFHFVRQIVITLSIRYTRGSLLQVACKNKRYEKEGENNYFGLCLVESR